MITFIFVTNSRRSFIILCVILCPLGWCGLCILLAFFSLGSYFKLVFLSKSKYQLTTYRFKPLSVIQCEDCLFFVFALVYLFPLFWTRYKISRLKIEKSLVFKGYKLQNEWNVQASEEYMGNPSPLVYSFIYLKFSMKVWLLTKREKVVLSKGERTQAKLCISSLIFIVVLLFKFCLKFSSL